METKPKNEELSEHTHLVRACEASLKIGVPDPKEISFRRCLLSRAADELPNLKPVFVTRLYEAACDVKFPSDEVTEFRHRLQPSLARIHGLEAYKASLPTRPRRVS